MTDTEFESATPIISESEDSQKPTASPESINKAAQELTGSAIQTEAPATETEEQGIPQWFTQSSIDEEDISIQSRESEATREKGSLAGVFTRASLGSALIGLDTLTERLEQVGAAERQFETVRRDPDSVLIPVEQWGQAFGVSAGNTTRHLMLGMMVDAKQRAGKGRRLFDRLTRIGGNAINFLFNPISSSAIVSPLRKGFGSVVERGESQVNHWITLGRAVDVNSRATAELAFEQTADDAMDELIDNERVQIFIQEIVQAQSQGIIDEIIEEIRERGVSADNFLERPFRMLLRRPPRPEVPPPDFERNLVRPQSRRHLPVRQNSLLGYYAGFVTRLVAFALDVAFLALFLAIAGWLLTAIMNLLGFQNIRQILPIFDNFSDALATAFLGLNGAAAALVYFWALWVFTGQTFGMMIMGIRVVAKDGSHLNFWQGLLRIFGLIVASIFLFLGFLWIIIDDRKQGWQDKIAGSYVVYSWDARPDETFLMQYFGALGR